jgi:hypothetical protein
MGGNVTEDSLAYLRPKENLKTYCLLSNLTAIGHLRHYANSFSVLINILFIPAATK